MHAVTGSKRRVLKTRATLLASFNRLLLERGFHAVSIRKLTADADVGRSTFYEHFEGKDHLLELSVADLTAVLAAAPADPAPSDALRHMLMHVMARTPLAQGLLRESTRSILTRVLARALEKNVRKIASRSGAVAIAPLPLLAESLAHTQLGFIEAWLDGDDRCDVQTAARVLHATTRAAAAVMFESTASL